MRRNPKIITKLATIRCVIVESPYRSTIPGEQANNVAYAWRCLEDCLKRGEAPYASHLLYAHLTPALDSNTQKRKFGIEAGLAWGKRADATVAYVNHGISEGMRLGIARAKLEGRPVEIRRLSC